VLQQNTAKDVPNTFLALHGVCSALGYLHTRQTSIVHGDVKAQNIMVETRNDQVHSKLLDFGLSQIQSRNPRHLGGTLRWMAPDVYHHQDGKPERSSDVYSFGRLIFFVLTGVKPLAGHTEAQVKHMLVTAMLPSVLWPGKSALEQFCKPLVDDCLLLEPSLRPPTPKIYEAVVAVARQNSELAGLRIEFAAPDQLRGWTDSAVHTCLAASVQHARRVQDQRYLTSMARETPVAEISSTARHALQGRRPTTKQSMLYTLLKAMHQWNFAVTDSPCCLFHCALAECISMCEQLQAMPCRPQFVPHSEGQCMTCGLLLDEGERCIACL